MTHRVPDSASGPAGDPIPPQSSFQPDLVAEVLSARLVRLGGVDTAVPPGGDPYQQVFATAHRAAHQLRRRVLVHGIDHLRRQQSWFTMAPDGATAAVPPPPASGPPPVQGPPAAPQEAAASRRPLWDDPAPHAAPPATAIMPLDPPTEEPPGAGTTAASPEEPAAPPAPAPPAPAPPVVGSRRRRRPDPPRTPTPAEPAPAPAPAPAPEVEPGEEASPVAQPLSRCHTVAVLSMKGGIGKTSTTVGVGLTLAEMRPDAPCTVDANPDAGDLLERALGERALLGTRPPTITGLVQSLDSIRSVQDLGAHLIEASGMHVLPGEQDPGLSRSLAAQDWARLHAELSRHYRLLLADCGTGVTHEAMSGVLQTADTVMIAASYAVSSAQRALQTLTWLRSHGFADLADRSIVVVTAKEEVSEKVDTSAIRETLEGLCRRLVVVPHDPAVVDGDRIRLDALRPETRRSYAEIAATIVEGAAETERAAGR